MNRNIDRTDVHGDNPVNLTLAHIGQRYIIPKQKGKAGIVIFEIKTFPHPRRQLVYKTEDAAIPAGMLPVHQVSVK